MEFNRTVHSFNGIEYGTNIIESENILDYLRRRVEDSGNKPFITEVSSSGQVSTITYREYYVKHMALTNHLLDNLEINHDNMIAILPRNDVNSILAITATLEVGATAVILKAKN